MTKVVPGRGASEELSMAYGSGGGTVRKGTDLRERHSPATLVPGPPWLATGIAVMCANGAHRSVCTVVCVAIAGHGPDSRVDTSDCPRIETGSEMNLI